MAEAEGARRRGDGGAVRWGVLAALALATAALVVAGLLWASTRGARAQPIAFNHRLHVKEVKAQCLDCHPHAVDGVRATIPNVETCTTCHAEPQGPSQEEARLVEYVKKKEPIRWRKVYWLPDHVYFSHRRHTRLGGLACAVCHGEVAELVRPITRPFRRPTMEGCIDCHRQAGARNDCVACHR